MVTHLLSGWALLVEAQYYAYAPWAKYDAGVNYIEDWRWVNGRQTQELTHHTVDINSSVPVVFSDATVEPEPMQPLPAVTMSAYGKMEDGNTRPNEWVVFEWALDLTWVKRWVLAPTFLTFTLSIEWYTTEMQWGYIKAHENIDRIILVDVDVGPLVITTLASRVLSAYGDRASIAYRSIFGAFVERAKDMARGRVKLRCTESTYGNSVQANLRCSIIIQQSQAAGFVGPTGSLKASSASSLTFPLPTHNHQCRSVAGASPFPTGNMRREYLSLMPASQDAGGSSDGAGEQEWLYLLPDGSEGALR